MQIMFRSIVLVLVVLCASALAFAPVRLAGVARSNLALHAEDIVKSSTGKESCPKRKVDKNGRCPGESGYVSFNPSDDRSFAEIKVTPSDQRS
jgi:hypothetical protein